MLRIACTSWGVRGSSISRLFFIEPERRTDHPRGTSPFSRDHVLLTPPHDTRRLIRLAEGAAEHTWGKHDGYQPAVLHDIDAPQCRHVIQKPAKVVFRVTRGYLLAHFGYFSQNSSRLQPVDPWNFRDVGVI